MTQCIWVDAYQHHGGTYLPDYKIPHARRRYFNHYPYVHLFRRQVVHPSSVSLEDSGLLREASTYLLAELPNTKSRKTVISNRQYLHVCLVISKPVIATAGLQVSSTNRKLNRELVYT
jgi:hypothetical protein